jgi:hypothetical protein
MPRFLVVHHTPSPILQEMFEAAVSGARTDQIEGVEVIIGLAQTAAALSENPRWGDLRAAYRDASGGPYQIVWPRGQSEFSVT